MSEVVIVGGGAWGTALAIQADRAGCQVTLCVRTGFAGRQNPRLPGHAIPDAVAVTTHVSRHPVAALIVAVPMQALRGTLGGIGAASPVLIGAKGFEAQTGALPLEILAEVQPEASGAVLTGPNFAHEVAAGLPAAATVAAAEPRLRAQFITLLGSPSFRLYGNDDPLGAQIGGAAKNVIAIAAGAVIGAGLGENARAALVTRGLAELGRLVVALGGRAETVAGLSGLGDLLLTCTGASSRNFRCGLALGRGEGLQAGPDGGVVEGVATAPALLKRAGALDLPICRAVAALLAGETRLDQAIAALMARPVRDE